MASTIDGYTLNWDGYANDFSNNLKNLLEQKELVDVTLVADGHLFSAHRLILSAISPYFRQMFTQVPANQQTYVFLKDVSKKTLEDLITFIYSGKVDVTNENLEEVLSVANALNIKGLSDRSFANSFDSQTQSLNSSIPIYESVQYQSTHTIRVPESAKPDKDQQPTNACDQYLTNVENENINEMIGHSDDYISSHYNQADYSCSNMCYDNSMAIDQEYTLQEDQWDANSIYSTGVKTAKPNDLKPMEFGVDTTGYNIIAVIRENGIGSENLFHENNKFNKHNKPNKWGQQRWQCTNRSQRCRAAVSTMEIDGAVMMKVVVAEHSH